MYNSACRYKVLLLLGVKQLKCPCHSVSACIIMDEILDCCTILLTVVYIGTPWFLCLVQCSSFCLDRRCLAPMAWCHGCHEHHHKPAEAYMHSIPGDCGESVWGDNGARAIAQSDCDSGVKLYMLSTCPVQLRVDCLHCVDPI